MKKVLKAMWRVFPWIMALLATCLGVHQQMGIEGTLIRMYGRNYLNDTDTDEGRMTNKEYMSLDEKEKDKVRSKAFDDIHTMRDTGWKWWLNK